MALSRVASTYRAEAGYSRIPVNTRNNTLQIGHLARLGIRCRPNELIDVLVALHVVGDVIMGIDEAGQDVGVRALRDDFRWDQRRQLPWWPLTPKPRPQRQG